MYVINLLIHVQLLLTEISESVTKMLNRRKLFDIYTLQLMVMIKPCTEKFRNKVVGGNVMIQKKRRWLKIL